MAHKKCTSLKNGVKWTVETFVQTHIQVYKAWAKPLRDNSAKQTSATKTTKLNVRQNKPGRTPQRMSWHAGMNISITEIGTVGFIRVPSTYQSGLCGQDTAFLQQLRQEWRWWRCGLLAKELLLGRVIQQWPVTCGIVSRSRRLRNHQSDWSWSLATEREQHGVPLL